MKPASPRTVLFIRLGRDWIRGSERVLLDLATGLSPEKFRPVVWCDAPAPRSACADAGIEVVQREFRRSSPRPGGGRTSSRYCAAEVIAATRAGVVHVNGLEPLSWALAAARRVRVPVLIHLHSPTTADERIFSGLHQGYRDRGRKPVCARLDGFGWNARRRGAADLQRGGTGTTGAGRCLGSCAQLGVPPRGDGRGDGGIADSPQRHRDGYPGGEAGCEPEPAAPPPRGWRGRRTTRLEAMVRDAGLTDRVHSLGDRQDVGAILRDAADVMISAAGSERRRSTFSKAGYFGLPMIVTDTPHREILTHESTGSSSSRGIRKTWRARCKAGK